jgi:hypothetical protein
MTLCQEFWNLAVINGRFESNGGFQVPCFEAIAYGTRVIGWDYVTGGGTNLADGTNGYYMPCSTIFPNSSNGTNYVATLMSGSPGNAFLQTLRAHLLPSTVYTFSVAIGMRDTSDVFGGYQLDLLAGGVSVGTTSGTAATLNALAGGSAMGEFITVSCVVTTAVLVASNQQLAIRITKIDGAGTYLDFNNVQVTSQLTPYGRWQQEYFGASTNYNPALGIYEYSPTVPASLPDADPNGDGQDNWVAYLTGDNPLDSNSVFKIASFTMATNGWFTFTWQSVGGKSYQVQFSDGDAGGGFNGAFTTIATVFTDPDPAGTPGTMSFTDDYTLTDGPPAHANRYYRVSLY